MNNWKPEDDWFHESNVQALVKNYLKSKLGTPTKEANCLKKERGPDLLFSKNGIDLQIEIKGYPSDKYARGPKIGKKKPTPPKTQAKHWFAQVMRDVIIAKGKNPNLQIAIGLPQYEVYETLWKYSLWATKKLGIKCYWVSEKGNVSISK